MNQALEDAAPTEPRREAFLVALGERVRRLRAIRGMTRKGLSQVTGVSERHLANLEHGVGNASILVLLQIAKAFNCALAELVGDVTTESPDWLLIRELLSGRTESDLQRAREALTQLFGVGAGAQRPNRTQRIALIGLRGAGKSPLGEALAAELGLPFIELDREIERDRVIRLGGDAGVADAVTGERPFGVQLRRRARRAIECGVRAGHGGDDRGGVRRNGLRRGEDRERLRVGGRCRGGRSDCRDDDDRPPETHTAHSPQNVARNVA